MITLILGTIIIFIGMILLAFNVDKVMEQLKKIIKINLKKGLIEIFVDKIRSYLKIIKSFDKVI